MRHGSALVVIATSVAACGFHAAIVDGGGGGGDGDGDPIDAIDGNEGSGSGSGMLMMTSFGERTTSEHQGVTSDTYIDSSNVTQTHGTDPGIWADASPTINVLLRFDVTALPTTATVMQAELDITTTVDSLESGTVDVYEALEAWTAADATWLQRSPSVNWTNAGASPPGSRGATLIGSVFPNVDFTAFTLPLDAATVQRWVTTPDDNHGLVLISSSPSGNGVTLSSSRDPTPATRPQLRVRYR